MTHTKASLERLIRVNYPPDKAEMERRVQSAKETLVELRKLRRKRKQRKDFKS